MSVMLLLLLVYLSVLEVLSSHNKQQITIVGLAPFSKYQKHVGEGIKPAVQLALDDINSDRDVLPAYNLTIQWIDTQCDMAIASKQLFDLYKDKVARTFVYGDYCSNVTKPLAESVHHFRLWQVSYADENPTLADKQTYPHFIRAVPSEIDMNYALVRFIQYNNWSRVSTIYQDASTGEPTFAFSHSKLSSALSTNNITVVTTESFASDPSANLDHIIGKDGRIIVGLFNMDNARQIMCKAYYKGMYGEKYVWLLSSTYPEKWWMDVRDTNCSESQMKEAISGYFSVKVEVLDHNVSRSTENGKPISDYKRRYKVARGDNYNRYHGYAYDGMWLIAKLLQSTSTGDRIHWEWFHKNFSLSKVAHIQYDGVTGPVKYENGSRLAQLSILQFFGERIVDVGQYHMVTKQMFINSSLIWWPRNKPPSDEIFRERRILKPNWIIQITLTSLAFLGQILAFFFLVINIKYRTRREIKMSSPNMNNLIIVGCFLIYSTIYLMRVDKNMVSDRIYEILCIAHAWVLSIGFTIAFGAMFSKTWRVYTIFNAPHKQRRAITDNKLALIVVGLIMMDLGLLITWTVVDPLQIQKTDIMDEEIDEILITSVICNCKSHKMEIWMSGFYAYKGLLLVAGCWFAWNTRTVKVQSLNDSKFIGLSVYNVVIVCITAVAISHFLSEKPDYLYLIVGLLTIICTTTTLCLVFAPKVMHLQKSGFKDEKKRPRVKIKAKKLTTSTISRQNSSKLEASVLALQQENQFHAKRLLQLVTIWEQLTKQVKDMGNGGKLTMLDNNHLTVPAMLENRSSPSETTLSLANNHVNTTTTDLTVVYDSTNHVTEETLLQFLDMQQSTHI